MLEVFTSLGRQLYERWARADFERQVFPRLAVDALERAQLHKRCSQRELLSWLAQTPHLPRQSELGFGQPPVMLYRDDRLYIEALFWVHATTTIHQHAFSGAFCVLEGSSVHSCYSFRQRQRLSDELALGELHSTSVELLGPGQVRAIVPGPEFIHALFHLECPTLSLVVRTHQSAAHPVQYAYYPPGLALDPFFQPEALTRRLHVLDTLLESAHSELRPFAEAFVDAADATALTLSLQRINLHLQGAALVAPLLERARARHPAFVPLLEEVLQHDRARSLLAARRRAITHPHLRLLLRLLLTVRGRTRILQLVALRFATDDPVQLVLHWLHELHETRLEAGNALGVDLDPDNF